MLALNAIWGHFLLNESSHIAKHGGHICLGVTNAVSLRIFHATFLAYSVYVYQHLITPHSRPPSTAPLTRSISFVSSIPSPPLDPPLSSPRCGRPSPFGACPHINLDPKKINCRSGSSISSCTSGLLACPRRWEYSEMHLSDSCISIHSCEPATSVRVE
jgi:hypothetical protein